MIDEIVTKTMRNGIVRFAKEAKVAHANSQLMIFMKQGEEMPCYKSLLQGKQAREVSFNEILGVRIDLLNREAIAAPFIGNSMRRFAAELETPPNNVYVLCWLSFNGQKLHLGLYKGAQFIRELELSDVLGQPTM